MNEILKKQIDFPKKLLRWHSENNRQMPWKETTDPYKIWLSEIILQQTRVEQGLPYYLEIVKKFPNVKDLALAPEDEVMKVWQGLGYYTRARNMHAAAKQIMQEYDGIFPETYKTILSLKGVGPYSAAAISSFSFNLAYAVLDGNVFRVLSRIFGIALPVDSSEGKKVFAETAHELLDKKNPAAYNQAIMNFGALICRPLNPDCLNCVFKRDCYAFNNGTIPLFPFKQKKVKVKNRWFNYVVISNGEEVFIERRNQNDIWQGLYQFPLIETNTYKNITQFKKILKSQSFLGGKDFTLRTVSDIVKHKLTHQRISVQFLKAETDFVKGNSWWLSVKKNDLQRYAFPKVIANYIENSLY
ncbi:MAG: A/G-specific adenine glycosylase [Chitinophagales bacterium]|nr:A/G-specific adenine glycosylase [Chitinophagales bacterium]